MTDNNNLTPPPELVQQWRTNGPHPYACATIEQIATQAARWGADIELEACVEWLQDPDLNVDTYKLRAARRPQQQPTFKELALKALDAITTNFHVHEPDAAAVRRALESLPEGPAVTPAADARGPGSVAEQGSGSLVAPFDNRLVIAEALRAEADGNDDKCHLVWTTSHELRKAAKILRGEESVAVPAVTTPVEHDWGEWPPERILRAADDEVGPMCEDPGYQRTRAAMAAAVKPVPSLGTMPDTPAVTPAPAPTADGWEKLGGAVHPGTVTTYTVPNPPEPAAAPDRPLWKLMRHGYDQSSVPTVLAEQSDPETGDCLTDRYGYAAELRVVADWLERRQIDDYAVVLPDVGEVIGWLRAEAEQAEAGQ